MSNRPFSPAAAMTLCSQLLPVADHAFEYMEKLQLAGFSAFAARHRDTESWCSGAQAMEIHRRCVIEEGKQLLGTPWPMALQLLGTASLHYTSPYLTKLQEHVDNENGVPLKRLGDKYSGAEFSWRSEIDPCLRAERRAVPDWHTDLKRQLAEVRRIIEREALEQAGGVSVGYQFSYEERHSFLVKVMGQELASEGFYFDEYKSKSGFPIFSKHVSDDWDLCWALEQSHLLTANPIQGFFEPRLELRPRSFRGTITRSKPGQVLVLRFQGVVPHFLAAYREFRNLDELALLIRAHVFLYQLMAPIIEPGISTALVSIDTSEANDRKGHS